MPLRLFSNRVFSAASAIGFVVGFAMFGALTFLPLFLQEVKGVSPIDSGVRLFPLMGGLLLASVGAGQVVSRWGRYKVFPIVGTALMTVGLYLLSKVGVTTGTWEMSAYMFIFGAGLGLVMQILVVAVQNAVGLRGPRRRHLGGQLLPADRGLVWRGRVRRGVRQPARGQRRPLRRSHTLHRRHPDTHAGAALAPPAQRALRAVHGVSQTVQHLFMIAVPIGVLAFALSWLLPEGELRRSIRTGADTGEAFAMPSDRTSLQEVRRTLEAAARRENRADVYRVLAQRAHLSLEPRACWLLYRLADAPGVSLPELARQLDVPVERLETGASDLAGAGMIRLDGRPGPDAEPPAANANTHCAAPGRTEKLHKAADRAA